MPTRSIPWPRILAEGFAIVVSILLAFGIQAWWEGRRERVEEQAILRGLEEDYLANVEELQTAIRFELGYEEVLSRLDTMTEDEITALPPDSVGLFMRAMGVSQMYEARDGTLDGVISSGRLDLIRDERTDQLEPVLDHDELVHRVAANHGTDVRSDSKEPLPVSA